MANYMLAYLRGDSYEDPDEAAAQQARWQAWVVENSDAMVNPGTPLGSTRIVSAVGVSDEEGSSPLIGFSVVSAESLEAALEMAKGCPYLEIGGIQVSEMMEM